MILVSSTKPTNPKDAIGCTKAPLSTVPLRPVLEVGAAMVEGACKYGRHNYRRAGVRATVYFDAAARHLFAWYEGQDIDPESGLSHVVKAIAGLMVLRDSMLQGNWVDDRPPKVVDSETWIPELNAETAEILSRYPNPKPPHTQIAFTSESGALLGGRPERCSCGAPLDTHGGVDCDELRALPPEHARE